MKSEWKIVKFSDIVEITSSKRIFRSDYLQDGIPFYRSKEVIEKSKGNSISTELFISEKKFEEIRNRYGAPEEGDILLTSVGTLGTSYIVKNNERFYFKDGNLTWFRSFSQDANNKFIFYWLQSNHAKHIFDTIAIGSTQKALTISALKSISFKLPPIQEQQKIASILSSLDDKIELNTTMNQTLEALVQTIFKSWFVDFEPFKEGKFIESELGMIPEGWSISSFSDTIDIIGGGTPKTTVELYWDGDIPWYSVVDVPSASDTYVIDTNKKITQLGLENSSAKIVEENITIISARGTVGKIALTGQPMTFNQSCYALQHKVGNYYGYFSTQKLVEALQQRAHGSVFDTITKDTFKSVIIVVPNQDVIKNFEKLVEPIMKQIKNNLLQTQALTSLRDTLLPKLMSGKVRV